MAAAFTTDQAVLVRIAAALKQASGPSALPDYWSTIANRAHRRATGAIYRRLGSRGFTAAQVAAWDDGAEYEEGVALYWALVEGGALDQFDDKAIREMARWEKELETVDVFTAGVWQTPAGPPLAVSTGDLNTGNDAFVAPDPCDPRTGNPTEW